MKNLVILGGGYGGINIAANILHQHFPEDIRIILIDRNPYHSLKTEFYATAAGTKADIDVRLNFPDDPRIDYILGEVEMIDTENQTIIFQDTTKNTNYDQLVIGLGAEDIYHGIPGAKEHTYSVQTINAARQAGVAVANTQPYGRIAIVGAGLSGVEVAAEIRSSRPDLKIQLFDRNAAVLRPFDMKIRDYVEAWLRKNDIEVVHHCQVEAVEADGIVNCGKKTPADVTIWTAGVQPNRIVRDLPYKKDRHQKLVVNEFYQVPEDNNVYVVGDCASSEYSPSAQLARQQGQQIARILLDDWQGKTLKKPRPIKLKGTLGSLGRSDGFGNMMDKPMTGWLPRIAKSGVLWLNKRH